MTDDIVTRLRDIASLRGNMSGNVIPVACIEAADEIERLRAEVARLGSFLHPIGAVVNGASGSRAETKWVGSDGTITNLDPNTEMGLWIRLFHNECDRSAHLEREIERLRAELDDASNVIENLHTYLYGTGMWFICGCDRPRCTEMRVYLGTVKTGE